MKTFKKFLLVCILVISLNVSVTYAHDDLPEPKSTNNVENHHIIKK